MKPGADADSVLREHWHQNLDSLTAPPELAELALMRAANESPAIKPASWRSGLAAAIVIAAAALGIGQVMHFPTRPLTQLAFHPSGKHMAMQSAGSAPHSKWVALASSPVSHLWALARSQGQWQLWNQASLTSSWQLKESMPGVSREEPLLTFQNGSGWMLFPAKEGGWRAWKIRDNGMRWKPWTLPPTRGSGGPIVLSSRPDAVYVVVGGSGATADRLYRKVGSHWRLLPARGLPRQVSALRINAAGRGMLVAQGALYETGDGGRDWRPLVANSVMTTAAAPMATGLSPQAISVASLQGMEARSGARHWVVAQGALWIKMPGAAWTRLARLPFSKPPKSLIFINDETGYLLSESGHIYVTHDGGVGWAPVRMP